MLRWSLWMAAAFAHTGCDRESLVRISSPSTVPESVYIAGDVHGNPVVAWVESDTVTGKHAMFYAVSTNKGNSFKDPIQVPIPDVINTHAEGMPKIAFMKNGGVIVAFEKSAATPENKYAGAIYYLYSADQRSWTKPRYLHSDTVSGRSRGFFDIQTLPDGSVGASWLDIKSDFKEKGRSIRFARTTGDGVFQGEQVVEPFACECCRTDLYVDSQGGINVAYRSVRKGNLDQLIRDMAWARSNDGGLTFSKPVMISDDHWVMDRCPHTGPALGSTAGGLHAIWYTEGSGTGLFYAQTSAGKFTGREQISLTAKHPQMATRDSEVFMVFEEFVRDESVIAWQARNTQGIRTGIIEGIQGYFPVVFAVDDGYCLAFLGKDAAGRGVFVKKYTDGTF